jgi:benzylsuccinate CoA-transferase BbsF subunit
MLGKPALQGIKIADFSWVGAGPRATKDLGDHGATVVKIESSKRVDLTRLTSPFKDGKFNVNGSGFFVHQNSSKYSATLNLQHPKGIEIAKRFVAWSDVVLENYGYGFMERMGLSYNDLMKVKPDIIMVSISIGGRTGPLANFRGYGNAAAALSGHAELTGWPDRSPLIPPITFGDIITPLFAVIAVLASVEYKNRTGKGQYIDISQLETMVQFIAPSYLDYFVNGRKQTRIGNRSPRAVPHGAFPCKEQDSWCTIVVADNNEWQRFCEAIGREDLLRDPRFKTFADRKTHEDELEEIVANWTKNNTKEMVLDKLKKAGIEAYPVQNAKELLEDPQFIEREVFVKLHHPVIGSCNHQSPPMKLSKTPPDVRPAPCLGEHNYYVYTELLGMSQEEFVELLNKGVFE